LPFKISKQAAVINLTALILCTFIVFIIKFTVKRTRKSSDYYFIRKVDPYSFPSGHISRLAGFIFSSFYFPVISVLFIFFCIAASYSRMVKKYHYFSDCLFGFIAGILCGLLAYIFSDYYLVIVNGIFIFK
jgi:membrane-associated phospholipid phosphatase